MSVPFVPGYVMAKLFSRRDAMATTAKQDAETLEDGMESRLALESVARDLDTLWILYEILQALIVTGMKKLVKSPKYEWSRRWNAKRETLCAIFPAPTPPSQAGDGSGYKNKSLNTQG
jgi:hypothetical protein